MTTSLEDEFQLIPVSKWTDDEWLRVLREFPPDAHAADVAKAVYRWRIEKTR